MSEIKTSFIMTSTEIASLTHEKTVPSPLQALLNQGVEIRDAPELEIEQKMVDRNLARWHDNLLLLEPVVALIRSNVLAYSELWVYRREETEQGPGFLIECPDMAILFERYPWADQTWRVTHFPDICALRDHLSCLGISVLS